MAIKQFEILEHTGDAKIRAFGKTREELFLNAMLGMRGLVRPKVKTESAKVKRIVKLISSDLNALLVDFLSEVNYLAQINKEVYDDAKFLKFSDTPHQNKFGAGQAELEAELFGSEVESFGEEIKAVTHHGLNISGSDKAGFEATILLDI